MTAPQSVMVAGMDGCRAGWALILHSPAEGALTLHIASTLREAAQIAEDAHVIAIDIPIGLPSAGSRRCDTEARQALGRFRGSSVFPAPPRTVLHATSHADASRRRRALEGKGLSIQTWAIVRKIQEVDTALRADDALRRRVREVHPELCFATLASHPLAHSKKSKEGRTERSQLLFQAFGANVERLVAGRDRASCAVDDVLDACIACWTATRVVTGAALVLPSQPERDDVGLPMEIVA